MYKFAWYQTLNCGFGGEFDISELDDRDYVKEYCPNKKVSTPYNFVGKAPPWAY